jgi:hypothetical protein
MFRQAYARAPIVVGGTAVVGSLAAGMVSERYIWSLYLETNTASDHSTPLACLVRPRRCIETTLL